jgi:hypothetical protein
VPIAATPRRTAKICQAVEVNIFHISIAFSCRVFPSSFPNPSSLFHFALSDLLSFNSYCLLISTMYTSLLTVIALALFNAPLTLAFEEINVNDTVSAGKDTTIQIVNDLSRGPQSFDGMFDSYRVYLSLTPPGWGSGPACYLVNSSAINVTSLTVQIPASVGPSDYSSQGYSIATMEFNQDLYANNGSSGFQYSNNFDFVGGTGKWSEYELAGFVVGNFDWIPCSAYNCARQCSQKYYPDNVNSNSIDTYKTTYDCLTACPGVSAPSWDLISGGGSGGGSSGGSSVGVGASTSTTSLAAAGGFTQSSSPMSTGAATASTSLASSTSSSGTSTASSTSSASTPTASKSAASLVSSSQFAVLAAGLTLLASLIKL